MSEALPQRQRRLGEWLLALAVGALGIWLVHRHQFSSGFELFPGPRGDTRLIAYLCEHWYQALRGKAALLSPAMFYPARGTLGYSDALLLFVPPYSLLRGGGCDIFTALAFTVVGFNFLNFVAGFALLFKALRFRWLPAVAGAMFFAFNNPKLSESDHLQLQPVWLLALIAACVVVFFRDTPSLTPRRAFGLLALAGLALDLQLLTAFYLGWFLIFWSGLLLGLAVCFRQSREFLQGALHHHWRPILAAISVTVAGLLPFLILYVPAVREVGGWPYSMALRYVPEFRSHLLMADGNFVWSPMTGAILQAAGNEPDLGRRVGIGVVPTVAWLAVSALAVRFRARRPFLALAILSVNLLIVLALQYHGHSPWHVLYKLVPGAKSIRAVSRFMIVAALPMSVAFAYAIEHAWQWSGTHVGSRVVLAVVIAFGAFEQFSSGAGEDYSIHAENSRLQRLAAKLPENCAAFYVTARQPDGQPLDSFQNQQWMHDAMFISIMRHVPTLNGRSGKSPPGWALREITAPDYEEKVRKWIKQRQISGRVCRLEIDE
jgi:hypothetical protein